MRALSSTIFATPKSRRIGVLYSFKNDFDNAIKYYGDFIAVVKDDKVRQTDAYLRLGDCNFISAKYWPAMDAYNKAIELDPLMANAYGNRANAYRNTKKYKEAIDDYDKSIEIKPNDAKTYHNRGTAKRDLQDLIGAMADYNISIKLDPSDGICYYKRANLKNDYKDYNGAITDFNKAIELIPNYAEAFLNRGMVLGFQKKIQKH